MLPLAWNRNLCNSAHMKTIIYKMTSFYMTRIRCGTMAKLQRFTCNTRLLQRPHTAITARRGYHKLSPQHSYICTEFYSIRPHLHYLDSSNARLPVLSYDAPSDCRSPGRQCTLLSRRSRTTSSRSRCGQSCHREPPRFSASDPTKHSRGTHRSNVLSDTRNRTTILTSHWFYI